MTAYVDVTQDGVKYIYWEGVIETLEHIVNLPAHEQFRCSICQGTGRSKVGAECMVCMGNGQTRFTDLEECPACHEVGGHHTYCITQDDQYAE